jgi:Rod binding domain-containing protein
MSVAGARITNINQGSNLQDHRLMKACQEFESVFLSIIWAEMSKSAGLDMAGWDVISSHALSGYWAKSGGIGLAKVIYDNMSK